MMDRCDMCGTKIENGKCSCGAWKNEEEMQNCPLKKAVEHFHDMKKFTLTGDAPHLGCAVVFFRGDYNDCKKLEKYIHILKNRPFYQE